MNIILGPPGTGKTTQLLNLVAEHLKSGVKHYEIGYLAFTRKAANEAKERAIKQFKLPEKQFLFFRTIHSLVFYLLGLTKERVVRKQHFEELGNFLGLTLSGMANSDDGTTYGMLPGDRLLFMEGLARIKQEDLYEVWKDSGEDDIDFYELERLKRAYDKYKSDRFLVDFTDMLHEFRTLPMDNLPRFKVLFIDEAQDLSKSQWDVVEMLIANADKTYIAGDDDQAIYNWAGASVDKFIGLDGHTTTLETSYRVPKAVQGISNGVLSSIVNRRSKRWKSTGEDGTVNYYSGIDDLDMSKGQWLLLARNGFMLKQLEDHCAYAGYSYDSTHRSPRKSPALSAVKAYEKLRDGKEITDDQRKLIMRYTSVLKNPMPIWHQGMDKLNTREREYFMAVRRAGEHLVGDARIQISTIHGAKGGEADNVVVLTDVAKKVYDNMQINMDDEARVFYVAVTRAKHNLHIVQPQTNLYYDL